MTEPTDAELDELRQANSGRLNFVTLSEFRTIARAVLAKWGTPAWEGEVVACGNCGGTGWMARDPDIGTDQECFVCDGSGRYSESATPHPTQAQAGAVPLTCEWAHNEDGGFWDTECGQSWLFDDGGPKENHMNFCHCCGKPLRIKGGQHGTE